ncbi:hypothetical protein [Pontibacter sp. H249]|uniref:hypothetical protein n=1 Tax=Pontibacter sp. H249 TaxID=3133420 RepID=UPI0030BC481B
MQNYEMKDTYTYKYQEALSLLEVVCHGHVSALELQENLKTIVALLHQTKATFLLLDVRLLHAAKSADENWVRTYCMPLLASTSICKLARIAWSTAIQQNIGNRILNAIDREGLYDFDIKVFEGREDALDWLFDTEPLEEQMPYRGDCRAFSLI